MAAPIPGQDNQAGEERERVARANERLFQAAEGYGGVGALRMSIGEGADPNARDRHGWTPLMHAAARGERACARELARLGADVSASLRGEDALIRAAMGGKEHMVEELLALGANPRASGDDGWTALSRAAQMGHFDCARRLIEAGADVDALSPRREDGLMMAAAQGSRDGVEMLLMAGAGRCSEAAQMARERGHATLAQWLAGRAAARSEGAELTRAVEGAGEVGGQGPARARL